MMSLRRILLLVMLVPLSLAAPLAACAQPQTPEVGGDAYRDLFDYLRDQGATGFLVMQDGQVAAEANWLAKDEKFRATFIHGTAASGALLEDVASQQKSVVGVLAAIAADKGLLDVRRSVSSYIGQGWSKAPAANEDAIRVIDLLTMTSGLDTHFQYAQPPGRVFLYNTPVYAVLQRVLEAASSRDLETITADWLTAPLGMSETAWRRRPAAMGDVGNPRGLVTTPRDLAKLGQMILNQGRSADGRQIVSATGLAALFEPSERNPAYGRLWWRNGGAYGILPDGRRVEGPLIPDAPQDLVMALGALDRKLYISPSRRLVVVRLGQAVSDKAFDETLWRKLLPLVR